MLRSFAVHLFPERAIDSECIQHFINTCMAAGFHGIEHVHILELENDMLHFLKLRILSATCF